MDAPMENMISSFRPEFLKNDKQNNDFQRLLSLVDENKLFAIQKKGALQEIVSHVHGCLNTSKHRVEGLVFLDKLVEQCVTEVYTQNAVTWIRFIIQCLESHDPPEVKSLASHIGCKILPLTVNFTTLSKEISAVTPQLLSVLLTSCSQWLDAALKLVSVTIQTYPGPCGTFKGKIENMLTGLFIDEMVSKEAITCYILLTSCGGGGTKGIRHTDAWTNRCQQILTSLNKVVDLLYESLNLTEVSTRSDINTLPMKDLPQTQADRFNLLTSYFNTYSCCLIELLSHPFPAPVRVPVDEIMQLIYKVLAVNNKILHSRPSTERLLLSGHISSIHSGAVLCLQCLISRCQTLLLPYSKSIVSLLVQELMWSQVPVVYGQSRGYSRLRYTVYKAALLWLQTTQSFTETTEEVDWLVKEILYDARPQTDNMKMDCSKDKRSSYNEPPPAKKKKKGGYSELSHGISSQRKVDMEANSEVCVSALKALYWLLNTVGPQLKQKTVQEIQEFITSVAIVFRQRGNYGIPYNNDRCRHSLLMVMQAFNLMPHPTASSILHYSLSILKCTIQDDSELVSSFSSESLHICEALVHARAPCFHRPKVIQREVIQDVTEKKQQSGTIISQSKIGLNKMPSLFESVKHNSSQQEKQTSISGVSGSGDHVNVQSTLDTREKNLETYTSSEILNSGTAQTRVDYDNTNLAQTKLMASSDLSNNTNNFKLDNENNSKETLELGETGTSENENNINYSPSHDCHMKSPSIQSKNISEPVAVIATCGSDVEMDVINTKKDDIMVSMTTSDTVTDNTIYNEDQEDVEDMLLSFVDADKD